MHSLRGEIPSSENLVLDAHSRLDAATAAYREEEARIAAEYRRFVAVLVACGGVG